MGGVEFAVDSEGAGSDAAACSGAAIWGATSGTGAAVFVSGGGDTSVGAGSDAAGLGATALGIVRAEGLGGATGTSGGAACATTTGGTSGVSIRVNIGAAIIFNADGFVIAECRYSIAMK